MTLAIMLLIYDIILAFISKISILQFYWYTLKQFISDNYEKKRHVLMD